MSGIIGPPPPVLYTVLREDTGVKDDIQTGFGKDKRVGAMGIYGDRVWHVDDTRVD